MAVEQVTLKCTDNGNTVKANLVSRSPELLIVYIPGIDTKLSMPFKGTLYVGNKAGLEFTSTGAVTR